MKGKIMKLICELIALVLLVLAFLWVYSLVRDVGLAEGVERWVICQPETKDGGYVAIREKAKKSSAEIGQLYLGSRVETDGKKKNGFQHIINAGTESGEGWVCARYLVEDQPVIVEQRAKVTGKGRVALRQYPGGKRTKWLKPGDELTVYAWTAEWCVTDRGYVDSDYLEGE